MSPFESAASLKNKGNLAMGRGELELAKSLYRTALQMDPSYMPACYNLGNVLRLQGLLVEALAAYEKAATLAPDDYEIHVNIGVTLHQMGRLEAAIQAFQRGVELAPHAIEPALNLAFTKGVLLAEQHRHPEAEAAFREALRLKPDFAEAASHLGQLLVTGQRHAEAEALFRQLLSLHPGHGEASHHLGLLLQEQQRLEEAEAVFRQLLLRRPDHAPTHNDLGNLLQEQNRHAEAEAAYRRALELRPELVEALNNLGLLLKKQRRFAEAEATCQRAIALQPDGADLHNNLGTLLAEMQRPQEAEAAYRKAIQFQTDHARAHYNLGNLLHDQHRLAEAEAAYRQALHSKPDYADARMNLGLLYLAQGRLLEGWPLYEARRPPQPPPGVSCPMWRGEDVTGKSLLLLPEQGLGDKIQFCRYVAQLKAMGARQLTLVCTAPLQALFQSLAGVDQLVVAEAGQSYPPHDYWSWLLSVPLRLGTTLESLPNALPYLAPPPDRLSRWASALPQRGFKVGLVWKGRSTHVNDRNRSLPGLEVLAPLWSVPGVSFVSLQKGEGEEEARTPPHGQPLLQMADGIQDFADTAAVVAHLDLVISIDSAVAHLVGAMGKPCWVLLPASGTDWRWLQERTDSPWYPGIMRLFRQKRSGEWSEVIAQAAEALARQAASGAG